MDMVYYRNRNHLIAHFILSCIISLILTFSIGLPLILFLIQNDYSGYRFQIATIAIFIILLLIFFYKSISHKLIFSDKNLLISNILKRKLIPWNSIVYVDARKGDTSLGQDVLLRQIPKLYSFLYERSSVALYYRKKNNIQREVLEIDQYSNQDTILNTFASKTSNAKNIDEIFSQYRRSQKKIIIIKAFVSLILLGLSFWIASKSSTNPIILSSILIILWWSEIPKLFKK